MSHTVSVTFVDCKCIDWFKLTFVSGIELVGKEHIHVNKSIWCYWLVGLRSDGTILCE